MHAVPPALHEGQHGLDDSHEPCQGILAAMKSPDGLSCVAQDEDVPPLPSPGLLADRILGGACRAWGPLEGHARRTENSDWSQQDFKNTTSLVMLQGRVRWVQAHQVQFL